LKLGVEFHVTVTKGVNEKYQTGVLPLCSRRALSERTGKPDGAPACEPTSIDDPPPAAAAGALTIPLNPAENGMISVPPLAGTVTMHGLPGQLALPPGKMTFVPPLPLPPPLQPAATTAPRPLSKNNTRNDARLINRPFLTDGLAKRRPK
jgi:hypothetical protein